MGRQSPASVRRLPVGFTSALPPSLFACLRLLAFIIVVIVTPGPTPALAQPVDDPSAGLSTPLRESIRSRHVNVTINVQILDFQRNYMNTKIGNFERLTGARVNTVESTQASWFSDIEEDLNGAGFIDLYSTFGNWIPTFVEDASSEDGDGSSDEADDGQKSGLADITDAVASQVGLDWFDIMPAVRSGVASYKNKVYTVPLDGDVIVMLYRTDLVESVGLPTPRTWDDVLQITRFYADPANADFTGDGMADYANCFSTSENDIAGTMFWSIASTFLQTRGTEQGTFFDPTTFQPKSAEPAFIDVLDVYQQLVASSPFREYGPTGWQDNLAEFEKGRCVLWYNYPGPTRILVSNQNANNMTGVLNYAPVPGMECNDSIECPFASSSSSSSSSSGGTGTLANHAPFLASGGMSFVVNARSSSAEQRAALDFSFYLSDPAVSYWDVAYPGSFLDPLRQRHTVALSNPDSPESQTFLGFGWEERQLPMLRDVTEFNFLHDNYVLDLRILGANEYQEAGTVPHLIAMWNWDNTAQETADAITESWNVITDKYGLREQRAMYRDVIGLPEYVEPESDDGAGARLDIIIPVVVVVGLLVVGLIVVVVKQHHTIRYKTRDIDKAPTKGMIALVFTDIEGSTALWEASKSTMSAALEVHHDTIRACIDRHGAYEVKTIGDAFMIAVGSADAAVRLANDVQHDLLNADWPVELASMPSACVDFFPTFGRSGHRAPPRPMFRGLRVRIGVHMGEHSEHAAAAGGGGEKQDKNQEDEEGAEAGAGGISQVEVMYDKVTKGYDYYGPATNAAARIEAMGFGGQTLISSVVYDALSDDVKTESSVSTVGALELRGLSQEVKLYQCLPVTLKGRRFQGVYRRRDSDGGSIVPDDDPSMRLGDSIHADADLVADVMGLTPVQLQSAVMRLRAKVKEMEKEMQEFEMYAMVGNGGQSRTNNNSDCDDASSSKEKVGVGSQGLSPITGEEQDSIDHDHEGNEGAFSDEG